MVPKIICSNCRQPIWITWSHDVIRCQYCNTTNEVIARKDAQYYGADSRNRYHVNKLCGYTRTNTIQDGIPNVRPSSLMRVPAIHPRKRAVLCGVTYKNKRKYKLKGTVNDVNLIQDLLVNDFKFPKENVHVLREDAQDRALIPTKKNIIDSLHWLVEDNQPGDSLVFYYSGHGLRQREFDGDESDGFDETICPVDFMTEGMIIDNEINSIIVRPLKKDVTLHAIMDACHSGTVLDLTRVYDHLRKNWIDNSPRSGAQKGTNGGLAICLSACQDDQVAADTSAFSRMMNGAMTYILVQTLKNNPKISYGKLLDHMYKALEEVNRNQSQKFRTRILRKFFPQHSFELPQLSSSSQFNVYDKEVRL